MPIMAIIRGVKAERKVVEKALGVEPEGHIKPSERVVMYGGAVHGKMTHKDEAAKVDNTAPAK
eukprot:CAMPEP_0184710026 /NCGR_PEP_ID=MMETSP0314-20130426/1001_1 /TAXON_ID=38298 /ORGANISM="Rhodella maculata, Strain CCMP 736" /LENGTH=62 /DNA_ID=CAMNT_0027171805 /DNA_START=65 /DNA_END=253 /DNA_ORIENTATION=-